MKSSISSLFTKFGETFNDIVLEWSDSQRASLLAGLMAFESTIYTSWAVFVYMNEWTHAYVNMTPINDLLPLTTVPFFVFVVFSWMFWSHITPKWQLFTEFVMMIVYTVYIGYLGYIIGFNTLLTGVSLSGGTALCVMLLKRYVSYFVLIINAIIIFLVLTVNALGYMPSTPIYSQPFGVMPLFWVMSYLYFLIVKIIVIFVTIDLMINSLKSSHAKVRFLSEFDSLTGLLNRHSMHLAFERMIDQENELSLIMLDIDCFKKINDTYGHLAGDEVLEAVADTLKQEVRSEDLVCRFGGEEFLVILPKTSLVETKAIAQRVCQRLAKRDILLQSGTTLNVTASFGVSGITANQAAKSPYRCESVSRGLIEAADRALYLAKQNGKNQVKVAAEADILACLGLSGGLLVAG